MHVVRARQYGTKIKNKCNSKTKIIVEVTVTMKSAKKENGSGTTKKDGHEWEQLKGDKGGIGKRRKKWQGE